MEKFEYYVHYCRPQAEFPELVTDEVWSEELEDALDALGREGWELVSGVPHIEDGYTRSIACLLKRRLE